MPYLAYSVTFVWQNYAWFHKFYLYFFIVFETMQMIYRKELIEIKGKTYSCYGVEIIVIFKNTIIIKTALGSNGVYSNETFKIIF